MIGQKYFTERLQLAENVEINFGWWFIASCLVISV